MITNPTVYFIITERWNYHCPFCIRKNLDKTGQEVSLESFRYVSKMIQERFPDSFLVLTGGETHIHSSFVPIVKIAASFYKTVVITTNGSIPEKYLIELLPLLRKNVFIQLSLDGPEEIHDALRGKGAFKKCLLCMDALRQVSDHLIVSSTVTFSSLDSFSILAKELNSYSFKYLKISPEQVENPLSDKIIPSEVWNGFVDTILPLCHYHVRIKKLFDFSIMDRYLASKQDVDKKHFTFNCGFGKAKFYITPTLDVLPCSCLGEVVGNLLTDSFDCIIDRLNKIGEITPDTYSQCYSCKYSSICNGGCPGYSKKVFGKYNMGDIRCPLIRNTHEKH